MYEAITVKILDNYNIWVKFNNGDEKIISILPFLNKGIAKELLDYEKFKDIKIDSGGGIYWSNGYDFCPNFLKSL